MPPDRWGDEAAVTQQLARNKLDAARIFNAYGRPPRPARNGPVPGGDSYPGQIVAIDAPRRLLCDPDSP